MDSIESKIQRMITDAYGIGDGTPHTAYQYLKEQAIEHLWMSNDEDATVFRTIYIDTARLLAAAASRVLIEDIGDQP